MQTKYHSSKLAVVPALSTYDFSSSLISHAKLLQTQHVKDMSLNRPTRHEVFNSCISDIVTHFTIKMNTSQLSMLVKEV